MRHAMRMQDLNRFVVSRLVRRNQAIGDTWCCTRKPAGLVYCVYVHVVHVDLAALCGNPTSCFYDESLSTHTTQLLLNEGYVDQQQQANSSHQVKIEYPSFVISKFMLYSYSHTQDDKNGSLLFSLELCLSRRCP